MNRAPAPSPKSFERNQLRSPRPAPALRTPSAPRTSPELRSPPAPRTTSELRSPSALRSRVIRGLKAKKMFLLLAETFQALGDFSRVQIVWALAQGELCVGDLARLLEMSQPAVSHHLRTLRNLRLVKVKKEGRTSFYSLDDEHIDRLLQEGIQHVEDLMK